MLCLEANTYDEKEIWIMVKNSFVPQDWEKNVLDVLIPVPDTTL